MPGDVNTYRSYALPWRNMPGDILGGVEIFAIGDVHGQADLLAEILHEIRNTPREAPIRHVVFLGDLTDRGPASISAVDLAMRAKELAAADVLNILPGNHDIALLLTLERPKYLDFWVQLGGDKVMAEVGMPVATHSWEEIAAKLKSVLHLDYLNAIGSGPTHLYLGDLLFVHAGIHPHQNRANFLALSCRCIGMEDHWANNRHSRRPLDRSRKMIEYGSVYLLADHCSYCLLL